MVSSASGYKFVDGLDSIKINGEIMPLRTGDHKRDLRGEDIAFLAEASSEVDKLVLGKELYSRISMEDRSLLAKRVDTVISRLNYGDGGKYLSPQASPINAQSVNGPEDTSFVDSIDESSLPKLIHVSPGDVVRMEPIENAFEWSQAVRSVFTRFCDDRLLPGASYSYNFTSYDGTDFPDPGWFSAGLYLYYYWDSGDDFIGTAFEWYTHTEEFTTNATYRFFINEDYSRAQCGEKHIALVFVHAYFESFRTSETKDAYYVVPFKMGDGGYVDVSSSDLISYAKKAANEKGIVKPAVFTDHCIIRYTIAGLRLQVIRGDHTLY